MALSEYTLVVITHGPPIFGNVCASNAGVAPQGMLQTHRGCEGVQVPGPCCWGERIYKLWQLTGQSFAKLT